LGAAVGKVDAVLAGGVVSVAVLVVAEVGVAMVGLALDTVSELVCGGIIRLGLNVGRGWAVGWCWGSDNNADWSRSRSSDNDWSWSSNGNGLRAEEDWSRGSAKKGQRTDDGCWCKADNWCWNVNMAVTSGSVGDDGCHQTR
jgi:hypothetical protein